MRLPGQYLQQAGLAAAVAPDEADALTLVELKTHIVQQGDMTESQHGFVQRNVWHQDCSLAIEAIVKFRDSASASLLNIAARNQQGRHFTLECAPLPR
jgi:hypothetical protein